MTHTRMTRAMRRSLEGRVADLDRRIAALDAQREGDDRLEATAMLVQLSAERDRIADALRDVTLIDDEPFDMDAIEIGDLVTIQDEEAETERYLLVDEGVGARARNDWVSVRSPLGAAIAGRSRGDRVEVQSPSGTASYVIVGFERASDEPRSSVAPQDAAAPKKLPSEAFLG